MFDDQRKRVLPVEPFELGIPPLITTAPVSSVSMKQRRRVPANQSLVSSKKSYNLKAPPTNHNIVTISTDDGDLSQEEDVKPIKRTSSRSPKIPILGNPITIALQYLLTKFPITPSTLKCDRSSKDKFAKACVLCLNPYYGNLSDFDIADAMWRMLRDL
ncbi:hypothetical protein B9Z19DRAFT_1068586 [Tuber borchii]|uniref:Uncharacterized protein n=1 Tax=Tuber borchii TaxID=42251 RepID=A0A2T6ZER4_TUBBO|nr:hypothetical protein B9Z19DRAFT_1068586 [Tuber borchii]